MKTNLPIWSDGPAEILEKAFDLLAENKESSTRISMILVDNATELMLQTYVSLPKRVTGISISRAQRDEYCKNFPSLLDGIEELADEKLIGLSLGEFEWLHRIRNRLYHDGNGLTVKKSLVEIYAELSLKLFSSLFGAELNLGRNVGERANKIGKFLNNWIELERDIFKLANLEKKAPLIAAIRRLQTDDKITEEQFFQIMQVVQIRNQLVHGQSDTDTMLKSENLIKLSNVRMLVDKLKRETNS
ncbi:hypothetical protein [Litorimonas sp. WD9-15]|uniref:hypothetical protein n=1 Tax=Litorimonas sp. WD9-15 TaxID=3418716 RepID=UPI003CFF7750